MTGCNRRQTRRSKAGESMLHESADLITTVTPQGFLHTVFIGAVCEGNHCASVVYGLCASESLNIWL